MAKIALFIITMLLLNSIKSDFFKNGKLVQNSIRFMEKETFPFQNESLPINARLDDLMDRLTVEEMVGQMAGGGGYPEDPAPAIPRLEIPPYQFDTECLHGIMNMPATSFPQSVGLAATFSEKVIFKVAAAIGTEARAYYNNASARGSYPDYQSANCFAPFNNVVHHPLWGRLQEVYGEDPLLSGKMASSYVKGMQGSHPKYVRAIAGCKVILVHSGPEDYPVSRMVFDAKVNEYDIRLTYLPSFKMCIEAGSLNLMCSYNSINGVPACGNKYLMEDIVRGELGFKGFIVSDMDAIFNIFNGHKYVDSTLKAASLAANAGVDLELHGKQEYRTFQLLNEAVKQNLVNASTIKNRTRNLFYGRMKLGLFDKAESNPYANIKLDVIQSDEHRRLATQAAAKSFVLLRNDFNVLPLKEGTIQKLAIIGPMANNSIQIIGNYAPIVVPRYTSTPYDGLRSAAKETVLVEGCSDTFCDDYNASAVIQATINAEYVILCIGTGWTIENEGKDRRTLNLPVKQQQLINDVSLYATNPVIILLFSGGPVSLAPMRNTKAALMQCFFPGETTGAALRMVLFESSSRTLISPAGRLPYTWPYDDNQLASISDYVAPTGTYRYWNSSLPEFPFGYGISYSKFVYSNLMMTPSIVRKNDVINIKVSVQNIGNYDSDEVVQVYGVWRNVSKVMPRIQLLVFDRKFIRKSSDIDVVVNFKSDQLMVWDDKNGLILKSGIVDIYVAGHQPFQNQISNVLHNVLTILN